MADAACVRFPVGIQHVQPLEREMKEDGDWAVATFKEREASSQGLKPPLHSEVDCCLQLRDVGAGPSRLLRVQPQ